MTLVADLSELKQQHQALKAQIDDEMQRPGADDLKISELKREKLHIKDEIARLESEKNA